MNQFARLLTISLIVAVITPAAFAQADLPANIDNGLHRLLTAGDQHQKVANATSYRAKVAKLQHATIRDSEQRVLIEVHLNGSVGLDKVGAQINDLGGKVMNQSTTYRQGVVSAFIPANRVIE
jgi:hypothetical protein